MRSVFSPIDPRSSGLAPASGPEMDLLIQCARLRLNDRREARIRALADAGLDIQKLIELALYHKLMPLLHLHTQSVLTGDRAHLPKSLRPFVLRNAERMLLLVGETLEVVWALEKGGFPSLPYKGAALAEQLYGNLALRQCGDIDILVRRADARLARALLIARGYRPLRPLSKADEAFMIANRYHETFVGERAVVELHWAFTNRDVHFPLDLDALSPGLIRISLGGHQVKALSPQDLLLILSVHGAKHRWDRLEWATGIAALLESGRVDPKLAIDVATRLGVRRMLLLGLRLAHDVLDAPLPPEVLAQVMEDRAVARLSSEVERFVLAGEPRSIEETGEVDHFRWRLRERWRDRLRFLLHRATTPSSPARWATVGVGRYYFPLHAVIRPWQVLGKAIALAHRRVFPQARKERSS